MSPNKSLKARPKRIQLFPSNLLQSRTKLIITAQKYLATNKVKLALSDIQSEITRQAKSQENTTHDEKACFHTLSDISYLLALTK